jgi:hypothetical protein
LKVLYLAAQKKPEVVVAPVANVTAEVITLPKVFDPSLRANITDVTNGGIMTIVYTKNISV